ncbi:heme oxygenase [Sphingobium sp. B12D2B]|nr:heme oxygenase [Sphingobium sp. B12D2B]
MRHSFRRGSQDHALYIAGTRCKFTTMSFDTDPGVAEIPTTAAVQPVAFHQVLKKETRADHDEVDSLFSQFDLTSRASYGRFLSAHAAALVPLERWLRSASPNIDTSARVRALTADLDALGQAVPEAEPLTWAPSTAAHWGAAYVTEGSRLGGAMLARRVPDDLPRDYLSAVHPQGAWRAFIAALEDQALTHGPVWQRETRAAATRTFALYRNCAIAMGARLGQ